MEETELPDTFPKAIDMFDPFKPDQCTLCGECFHRCPVLQLPLALAKAEIKHLLAGKETQVVLQKCQSCFFCNIICPKECNPAQLILQRWNEYYQEKGLPATARHYDTLHPHNFRSYTVMSRRFPKDERKLLEEWRRLDKVEGTYCYPGCNICTASYLTKTKLLEGLDIRGGLDFCCSETYYRTGLLDVVKRQTKRLNRYFKKLGVRKMVILCTAGYNVLSNILPHFGAEFQFPIQSYLSYLWERIEDGRIKLKRKIPWTVTIQDSCYSKMFGSDYMDLPRKILERLGAKIVEMEHSRESVLCCGIAGGFSPYSGYHPLDLIKATLKRLRAAKKTGANVHVIYCAGCLQTLSVVKILYPTPLSLPVYHILELLQLAIGETPVRRQTSRALTMFLGIVIKQFPRLLFRKRYKIPP